MVKINIIKDEKLLEDQITIRSRCLGHPENQIYPIDMVIDGNEIVTIEFEDGFLESIKFSNEGKNSLHKQRNVKGE